MFCNLGPRHRVACYGGCNELDNLTGNVRVVCLSCVIYINLVLVRILFGPVLKLIFIFWYLLTICFFRRSSRRSSCLLLRCELERAPCPAAEAAAKARRSFGPRSDPPPQISGRHSLHTFAGLLGRPPASLPPLPFSTWKLLCTRSALLPLVLNYGRLVMRPRHQQQAEEARAPKPERSQWKKQPHQERSRSSTDLNSATGTPTVADER